MNPMAKSTSLLANMDRLWFHQTILSWEPVSTVCAKNVLQSSCPSTEISFLEEDSASTDSSTSSISQDDCSIDQLDDEDKEAQRPTRLTLICNKSRSQSSSPLIHRPRKSLNQFKDKCQKLQRFLSCKTLHDLELEELKGFMDLGFRFEKDQLSPRTMNVVPGLQRLGQHAATNVNENSATTIFDGKHDETEEPKLEMVRPYLSEAWLIKKPTSPLLRLRMARVSTTQDMKNCLKLWAKTVASTIPI